MKNAVIAAVVAALVSSGAGYAAVRINGHSIKRHSIPLNRLIGKLSPGPQGPTGPVGAQGATGPQGPAGPGPRYDLQAGYLCVNRTNDVRWASEQNGNPVCDVDYRLVEIALIG